ncbi:MAG: hypothetical protein ACN4E2_03940 [Nitrospinota bacterium]
MIYKKFQGQDMQEALRLVKSELGSEALIISSKEVVSDQDSFGRLTRPVIEVTASLPINNQRSIDKSAASADLAEQILGSLNPTLERIEAAQSEIQNHSLRLRELRVDIEDQNFELIELKGLLALLVEKSLTAKIKEQGSSYYKLGAILQAEGIATEFVSIILDDIFKATADKVKGQPDLKYLLKIASQKLKRLVVTGKRFFPPNEGEKKQRIIMFAGSSGSGKTTTILKLAANLLAIGQKVAILSLDSKRLSQQEALKSYSKVLNIPYKSLFSVQYLDDEVRSLGGKDIIFIDTPGKSLADIDHIDELKELYSVNVNPELYLTISATSSPENIERTIKLYSRLSIESLIITKVDEVEKFGTIFNQNLRSGIAISYFCNGQNVPLDIEPATEEIFIKRLLQNSRHHT